ncbi:hypothetical protein JB92DRAFT_1739780 [Gautieria morchelliformis]|nr:hypothetical protein JB92DRAFT_1739780 [Gautieria morchelliformis]
MLTDSAHKQHKQHEIAYTEPRESVSAYGSQGEEQTHIGNGVDAVDDGLRWRVGTPGIEIRHEPRAHSSDSQSTHQGEVSAPCAATEVRIKRISRERSNELGEDLELE